MQSQQPELRKATRRARVPLSCDPCRFRKLKCNREKPCQNCAARGEQSTCKFRGPVNSSSQRGLANDAGPNGDAMRQRIDHLEDLVKRLVAERAQSSPPSNYGVGVQTPAKTPSSEGGNSVRSENPGSLAGGPGRTVIDGTHSVYLGGDDWSAVLQEINEIKRAWNHDEDELDEDQLRTIPSHTVDGSSLLFDPVKPLERMGILSTLPPKHEVDRLVAYFFDRQAFPLSIPPLLHEPTFMREYEEHWKDPLSTNFIWLGLLFSIISITMLAYHQHGEPSQYQGLSESLSQLYRMRTGQCLLSGDIAKCLPYTVETLRFNATAELNRKDDNRRGLWIMTGMVVRAAINMGYHRDPAQSPGISVFHAEYRRRVWASVTSMDDMASFLGGFPRSLSSVFSDTLDPRNLHDWELSEDMTELPPSRPLIEATDSTYMIVKTRIFRDIGRVADFNSNPSSNSYETALEIDRAMHETYESFPKYMRVPLPADPVKESEMLPYRGLINWLNLACMYHRGICTLHRKFLAKSRIESRYKLSRDRCITSALGLLAFQDILEPAVYQISRSRQLLVLAAMVLFLELALRRKNPDEGGAWTVPESSVLIGALEKSAIHLEKAIDGCEEARKVHTVLVNMLSSFGAGPATSCAETGPYYAPEQSLELNGNTPFDTPNGGLLLERNWPDSMDFDWATWDNFIEESSLENGPIL